MSPLGKLLKWGTFLFEAFLAIPLVGGLFVMANGWTPLIIALIAHIAAIIILYQERGPIVGNMLGVVTSLIAFIPFVGWIMHGITAIVLLVEGISAGRRYRRY